MITRKKRWLFVPVLVGLLTIGITAGVALANGGGENGKSAVDSSASVVAATLGQEGSQVQNVFFQDSEGEEKKGGKCSKGRLSGDGSTDQTQGGSSSFFAQPSQGLFSGIDQILTY